MVVGILIIFHVKREHGTFRKGGVIYAYHVLWKEGLGGRHAGSEVGRYPVLRASFNPFYLGTWG
jgi:hypothetical protein